MTDYEEHLGMVQTFKSTKASLFIYLFLRCSSSAFGELAVVVHGGGPASRGLAALAALGVQHPPRALPRALILDANKAAV